jgi:hypothetical protein
MGHQPKEATMPKDILTQIMGFAYSAAHYLGTWIVALIQKILPMAKELGTLADPIGYLAILTIFVIITVTVKKVAVIILLVGWGLIVLRVVLMAIGV